MNYWFTVEERPGRGWWVVIRREVYKDGREVTYINDILYNEPDARKSAEGSQGRHLLWDHYEALHMNDY